MSARSLSNMDVDDIASSQLSNIEVDIKQQKIDKLLENAIDLPDSILTTFINIIKKIAQEQFRQPQYLKTWVTLLNILINTDNKEFSLGVSLLKLMRYNKGPNTGKIFSKYLQQKAYNFIENLLYRPNNSHITSRSAARKTPTVTNKQLKLAIRDRLIKNKKQYRSKAVLMATQICEIGEMSYRSAVEKGFSTQKHPFNLLYLIWKLHNGYSESNKDNPINMKSSYIFDLYFELFGIRLTKFQKPLRQRWLYELQAARQLVERREHLEKFTLRFLNNLKLKKKIPKTYLQKWELLQEWLMDPDLKIQVECLVKFGEKIYEPMMNFFIGSDKEPRVLQPDGQLLPLPPGRRAHEMPDAFIKWNRNLYSIRNNLCSFFDKELWDATNILDDEGFGKFFDNLELSIIKAISSLDNWMSMWLRLPLSVCRLGGKDG
ncbi:7231_t:CDS:2, partial [Gigaspora margarita]